ncbi:MAG: Ig-like domain-containing protein [Burkholderiaceae bacterium]|jgi:hypothetical protein|nr:Ig-like domain-containing protein [Burkholderiaceae bacterium]
MTVRHALTAVLSAVALTGCGGGDSSGTPSSALGSGSESVAFTTRDLTQAPSGAPNTYVVNSTTLTLQGTAKGFSKVTIAADGAVAGTTIVDASGNWSYKLPEQSQGSHTYSVLGQNAAGLYKTVSINVIVNTGNTGNTGGACIGSVSAASLGVNASLNGCRPFPASNDWNRDVSADPVDPNSNALIASIGLSTGLHPDFGSGYGNPFGIPYVIVPGSQRKVAINFTAYGDESDPGPYPVPANAPIEGGSAADGDRHVLVIDRDNQRLYELFAAFPQSDGSWNAASGAVFDLTSNTVRPGGQPGWTSTDAAGLPIFPGLVRYDEVASGAIRHALRFTVQRSRRAYVPPAAHWASSNTDGNLPPMGMRVRLKASYVIPANADPQTRVILQALKTYGMIVADNGSNWFISGAPDPHWNDEVLVPQLRAVTGSNFEVVKMNGLVTDSPPQPTSQTIQFTSQPPNNPNAGATYTVQMTGGGSGNPVVVTIDALSASVCSINQATSVVTFKANGNCVITANQAGGVNGGVTYTAAVQASQSIHVGPSGPTTASCQPAYASVAGADLGINASLNGCQPFPASNEWNRDISNAPVDPNSDNLIASMGAGVGGLHPDFGSGYGSPFGIPYVVVAGNQKKVTVNFTNSAESDPGPYPIPATVPIESDAHHVLVIDRDNQRLYELLYAFLQPDGSWTAASGAIFDLTSNNMRPGGQPGWVSADPAGMVIFPGLVRYDEVASGVIRHALRFSTSTAKTRRAYLPPASRWVSNDTNPNLPPMGMRVRLKASYVIPDTFDPSTRTILQALKTYGMILADNGSSWFLSGTPDDRWDDDKLVNQMRGIGPSNFEVVRMDGLVTQ